MDQWQNGLSQMVLDWCSMSVAALADLGPRCKGDLLG